MTKGGSLASKNSNLVKFSFRTPLSKFYEHWPYSLKNSQRPLSSFFGHFAALLRPMMTMDRSFFSPALPQFFQFFHILIHSVGTLEPEFCVSRPAVCRLGPPGPYSLHSPLFIIQHNHDPQQKLLRNFHNFALPNFILRRLNNFYRCHRSRSW